MSWSILSGNQYNPLFTNSFLKLLISYIKSNFMLNKKYTSTNSKSSNLQAYID